MKKILLILALSSIALLFSAYDSPKSLINSENDSKLIGVWKNVTPGQGGIMIKIITKDRFMWTWSFDNIIISSAGGVYHFDGKTYTETIEYGTNNQGPIIGKKAIVKVEFEGDNRFHSSGMLADRIPLNEVWERIE